MKKTEYRTTRGLWMALFLLILIPGCECSDIPETSGTEAGSDTTAVTYDPHAVITEFEPVELPGGQRGLSEIMMQDLQYHFGKHMKAQNNGDYETYVDYYYKPMLDRMNRDTLVHYVRYYADETGCQNYVEDFKIGKITPVVETDSTYIVLFEAMVNLDVVFTDKFKDDPITWQDMIKSKYPTAVYDPSNRKYNCDETMKFFGITSKKTLDFRFLIYNYYTDPSLSDLIEQSTFVKLRELENQ